MNWTLRQPLTVPESATQRGIWFLRRNQAGMWECLPAASLGNRVYFQNLSFPIAAGPAPAALAYASGESVTDKVILELAGSKTSNPMATVMALSDWTSPALTRALQYLAANDTPQRALYWLGALIGLGDIPSLLRAEQAAATLDGPHDGAGHVLGSIRVYFRNPDPVAINSLGRMATSRTSPLELRRATTAALSAIHTADALPWLGSVLTDASSGPDVQLSAAQGISFFVNGVGLASPETMRTLDHLNTRQPAALHSAQTEAHLGYATGQSVEYLQFWTAWWQGHPELHSSPQK